MYIISETLSSEDPRVHPEIVKIGDYWHFTISYIPPNKGIFIDWMQVKLLKLEVMSKLTLLWILN